MTKVLSQEEIEQLLSTNYKSDQFVKDFFVIFKRAMFLCAKARFEGLLSLEDEWDEEKSDNRDIFEYGLRLVIDGTEDSFINKILSNIINQEQDENKIILKTIQKEAVLAIQSCYHPRPFSYLLNSYTNIPLNDPVFKKICDDIYNWESEWYNRTSHKSTLEKLTCGLQEGKLTVIASKPGMGKTRLALIMAKYMTCVKDKKIAFFSLEVAKDKLCDRLNGIHLGVECRNSAACPQEASLDVPPFDIIDNPGMTFSELEQYIRNLCGEKKIEAVFIDYLGLLNYGEGLAERKKEQIKMIAKLKTLAKELNISIIALLTLPGDNVDAALHIINSKLYFDENDSCIIDELILISKSCSKDSFDIYQHSKDNNWTKERVRWMFPI